MIKKLLAIMAILLAIGLAFGEDINWGINGKVLYIKTEKSPNDVKTGTISPGGSKNWDVDLSLSLSNYQGHVTINCYENGSKCVITARIVIDDAIIQQNPEAVSVFLGNIEIDDGNRKIFVVTNYNSSIIGNYLNSIISNYSNVSNYNYKNQTITWILPNKSSYNLSISYNRTTFLIYSQNFNESRSMKANESVSKDYIITNPPHISSGGVHITINSSRNGSIVIAKVKTDDSTWIGGLGGGWVGVITGYYSYGTITINGISRPFALLPGGEEELVWQQIKAPIPSIAIALILITIPIIALRKLN